MDEHTWTAAGSYSDSENDEATVQLKVKDAQANRDHDLCDWLLRQAMADLADDIDTPAPSLVVFNMLNWTRSGKGFSWTYGTDMEFLTAQQGDRFQHKLSPKENPRAECCFEPRTCRLSAIKHTC